MNFEPQIVEVGIEEIIPNRFQPRLTFDEKAMEELAASIKEHGIIQPLVLRRVENKYEIIAGERRYKASIMAGLQKVPAIITNLDDNSSAEVALVENVQRKGLTPIEEAKSYKVLLDRGYITQEELAKKIGIAQPTLSNRLRLLNLDEEVQKALLEEKISERHARSILQITDKEKQKALLKRVIDERLTVKQLDMEIQNMNKEVNKMDDTPLIEITPSVEEIKTTATDINPQVLSPGIEEMLKPDPMLTPLTPLNNNPVVSEAIIPSTMPINNNQTGDEESGSAPMVSLEPKPEAMINVNMPAGSTPEQTPQPSQNKFFNFLEDEEANLNIADKPIETPTVNPVVEPAPSTVEVLDIPMPSPNLSMQNVVDPVSKIDTLDPSYVAPVVETEEKAYSLTDAINALRDTVKAIEAKGLLIDTEEIDLENLYQIIIKIDKKTE